MTLDMICLNEDRHLNNLALIMRGNDFYPAPIFAPFYRIVVADSRSPRDGRFIEEIGTYDPNLEPSAIKVDEEAAKKWLNNGAQPTEVVGKIFKAAGIEK